VLLLVSTELLPVEIYDQKGNKVMVSVPLKRCRLILLSIVGLFMAVVPSSFAQILTANFDDLPAGSQVFGNTTVSGGVLHLTDNANSQSGAWLSPTIPNRIASYTIRFKALVGGGTCCGDPTTGNPTSTADGFSVNVANDLPAGPYPIAEEGAGTGLSVCFDTWDNGGGEAPAIDIKWKGATLRSVRTQVAQSPNVALDVFKDVVITVTEFGLVTVNYDGTNVMSNVEIPGYTAQSGLALGMGGRTGGANENHWIDDLRVDVGLAELSSTQLIAPAGRTWKYDDTTLTPGLAAGWELPNYDDSAWKSGPSLFGNDGAGIYDTATQPFAGRGVNGFETPLDRNNGRITFYFRTKFTWNGSAAGVVLTASNWVDDGIIAYLNGTEVNRIRIADGPVTWDTLGANPPTEGAVEVTTWSAASLVQGENTIAVELHQSSATSSDAAFALSLNAVAPLKPTLLNPSEPTNRVVFANRSTTLSVIAIGSPAPTYQWFKDGVEIPGATSADYVIPLMAASDAGAYFARVSNPIGTVDSRTATVGYVLDNAPPAIAEVVGSSTFDKITLVFNELVERNSAEDEFNYSVADSGGNPLTVTLAELSADGKSVTLTLDPGTLQAPDTLYTVTVINIADAAGNILASGSATFRSWVPGPCNGVLFEVYDTPGRSTIDNLINNQPNFPNNPRERYLISGFDSRLAYADDAHEDYSGRLRGLFIPSVSGNYLFHMRSDDPGRLFFNPTGPSAAGKIVVGNQPGCCNVFPATGAQLSQPYALEAGKGYYVEMLYWEYGGGDYGQVAIQLQGTPAPSAPNLLGSLVGAGAAPAGVGGPLNLTQQPADQSLFANATASFSVVASNPNGLPVCYQWRRDGVDIPGANGPTYSFGPVSLADNGAMFDAVVSIIGATTTTTAARLTVAEDVTKPTVVSVKGGTDLAKVVVVFSEIVEDNSGGDEFGYSVVGGPQTLEATIGADRKTVTLKLEAPLSVDTQYTLAVSAVKDLSGNTMVDASIPFRTFAIVPGFALAQIYLNIPGGTVADLTGNAKYPSSPDLERYKGLLELNTFDEFENYGARMSGWLTAPVSGAYTFYMSSDDNGALYLSTDSSPANLVQIALEPVWNGRRDWVGTTRRDAANPENRSTRLFPAGITLTAGQSYYFEALVKEGGGGDNLAVNWRIPGEPEPLNGSSPISGVYMSSLADPSGAQLRITQQPVDQTFVISSDSILNETFTSGNGGFTVETPAGEGFTAPWTYDGAAGTWQVTQQNEEIQHRMTSILISPEMTVTKAGTVTLRFNHRYSFEGGRWDGGQVQISVNGGAYAAVPASAFTQNGYTALPVLANSASALAGQAAFTEDSAGHAAGTFLTSVAGLGSFNPGDKIRLRFLYAGDTNTRGGLTPNWEVSSLEVNQGGGAVQAVTFAATIEASKAGEATPTIFYQWMRDNGSGFAPVPGANGPTLTFTPILSDNGARFRLQVYILGANATSDVVTLHVISPNTPPRFTGGPNQTVAEDSGAQTVPNWATDISVHSISRAPITYSNDFSAGLAGMQAFGIAAVVNGVLQLTTPINDSYGAASISAPIQTYESLTVNWKSRVGGGAGGGADGYSLNIGSDVPADPGYGGEEGIGTGLTVTVDTFDNGTGLDVGVDIKWAGSRVAYVGIPKDDDGSGNFLRKDTFVDAKLSLSPGGVASVTYDGNTISATIPNYAGLRADRALFWARTGGANDNQWVDDFGFNGFLFDSSSSENGQTIQFIVSNDNPSLFSVQPAVSPTGTLTYTPAPNANGLATITVVAKDSGGTAAGGNDTSAPYTFTIRVTPVNDCPTLASVAPISVVSGATANGQLVGADVDGDVVSYVIVAPPAHGVVVLQAATGAFSYTSAAGYVGPDSFGVASSDGTCRSSTVTVNVNVTPSGPSNRCPVPVAKVQPNIILAPGQVETVVISSNGTNACLSLDGTMSSDLDSDPLTYSWVVVLGNGSTVPLASGATATACLEVGTYTVRLIVDDGQCARSADVTVEIITAGEAIDVLIDKVNNSSIERKNKRPFIASLKAAVASFDRGSCNSGSNQLKAFTNKVRAQVSRSNPDVAAEWIALANAILAQIDCPEE
jgi:hypothetical protein